MAAASVNENQVATPKTIESALKLTAEKKEKLKKAYDDLRHHSCLLLSSAFPLSWSDVDAHFSSRQNDLSLRFRLLQSVADPCSSSRVQEQPSSSQLADSELDLAVGSSPELGGPSRDPGPQVAGRPELIPFCEKQDGKGLRDWISDHAKQRVAIRAGLATALRASSDPSELVLNAMEGFYPANSSLKGDKDPKLYRLRRSCLDLLEVLVDLKPNVSDEVREKAKHLALEWKGKVSLSGDNPSEAMAFLHVVVAYGLQDQFDVSDLVVYFVVIARFKQSITLCRDIGLGEKTTVLVQKLIDGGKQPLAVKFAIELGLTEKFEPVSLLEAYLKDCRNSTNQTCKDGKNPIQAKNEAKTKEVSALNSVLQVIDEYKLQSYPKIEIEKRIEMLQSQMSSGKQTTPHFDIKPQEQQQQKNKRKQMQVPKQPPARKVQHKGNMRLKNSGPTLAMSAHGLQFPPFHQSQLQPTGLFQASGPYGMASTSPPNAPYAGSFARQYGFPGGGIGFPETSNPPAAHQYPSGSHMVSGYYDGGQAAGYHGGYGYPSQHHPNY